MKQKTYKELENEKQRGKKRFLERVAEEQEADEQIRDFVPEQEDSPDREN